MKVYHNKVFINIYKMWKEYTDELTAKFKKTWSHLSQLIKTNKFLRKYSNIFVK